MKGLDLGFFLERQKLKKNYRQIERMKEEDQLTHSMSRSMTY